MNEQLELPLWKTLRSAELIPHAVNVRELLGQVEHELAQVPEKDQLKVAGEALLRVAEVYAMRAEILITEWEETYRDPRVDPQFFEDIVRQTMAIDLSELMEPLPSRKARAKRPKAGNEMEESVAAPVEKAALLELVDQLEAAAAQERANQQAFEIAYEENVLAWITAIAEWLQAMPNQQASFKQLCRSLGMPQVEVWLGVLLGEFELEQGEEFYSDELWVKVTAVDP